MRALFRALFLLIAVEVALVLLVAAQPGDLCATLAPEDLDPIALRAWRAAWSCEAGVGAQLRSAAWMIFTLDLGDSPRLYMPVRTALLEGAAGTLALTTPALALGATVGIGIGWAQAFGSRRVDRTLAAIGAAAGAVPSFGVALLLMLAAMRLFPGWPLSGSCHGAVDCVQRAVLPVLTLAVPVAATHARLARNALRAELRGEYVLAARARGVPEPRVRIGHVARNALPAWIAVLGLDLPWLFTGALVVEYSFARPGLGALLAKAASAQDVPVLVGGAAVVTIAVISGDLLARNVQARLDPRSRA